MCRSWQSWRGGKSRSFYLFDTLGDPAVWSPVHLDYPEVRMSVTVVPPVVQVGRFLEEGVDCAVLVDYLLWFTLSSTIKKNLDWSKRWQIVSESYQSQQRAPRPVPGISHFRLFINHLIPARRVDTAHTSGGIREVWKRCKGAAWCGKYYRPAYSWSQMKGGVCRARTSVSACQGFGSVGWRSCEIIGPY